jgi:hypothetical protein
MTELVILTDHLANIPPEMKHVGRVLAQLALNGDEINSALKRSPFHLSANNFLSVNDHFILVSEICGLQPE